MTSLRFFFAAAFAAGLFVVAACGSSENPGADSPSGVDASSDGSPTSDAGADAASAKADGGEGGTVPSVEPADFCPAEAKSICTFFETCSPDLVTALWASPAECEPRFRDNCFAAYPPNAKVRKDDADAYATCLEKLVCDDLYGPRWTFACSRPRLAATKPAGEPCRSDFECESGACTGGSTQCGTCVTVKKAGEACTGDSECGAAGYCDEKCVVMASLGDSCDDVNRCGNGLACESGKCVKIGAVGSDCDSDIDCDRANLVQCNKSAGKCEKIAFLDPGETCPGSFDDDAPKACSKGSTCISQQLEAGTCVTNAKVGEACGSDVKCESFINCRNGQCVLPTYKACP